MPRSKSVFIWLHGTTAGPAGASATPAAALADFFFFDGENGAMPLGTARARAMTSSRQLLNRTVKSLRFRDYGREAPRRDAPSPLARAAR